MGNKKKSKFNPPKKNDSSVPYVERLAAERKEKEEQQLLSDERVKQKLEELDQAQKAAEEKLENDRKALDDVLLSICINRGTTLYRR